MKSAFINDLLEKISHVLPQDLHGFKEDTQKNIRAVLQSVFEKMELVTQEDFEVQKKLLARSQERIEQLSQSLQQLEEKLDGK